jgi:hypothetical protein
MTDTKIPKLLLLDTDVEQIKRLLNDKALENNQYCRMLRENCCKRATASQCYYHAFKN